ncbi:MAG: ATP-binding protein [Rhodothermales bacterium]|nr:ATP-binding protein [Rhodothermales bacterium]
MPGLDEHLVGFVRPVAPDADLVPSHRRLAEEIAAVWARSSGGRLPAVLLCGTEAASKPAIAAAACARLGLGLYRMPAAVLPAGPHEADALLRLWAREAVLSGSALLLGVGDDGDAALTRRFVEEVEGPLLVAASERTPTLRPPVAFDVARPTRAEQRALWAESLGPQAAGLNGHVDRLTAQFDLSAPAIRAAGLHALGSHAEGEAPEAVLWAASRAQARQALGGLARRIEPAATWDDLVLPEPQRRVLREIELHVRHRLRVHETWGFARRSGRGLGITALFAGPSGTGKTLAAEVLAHALRLDLYHIDLSGVVSKYIGETEKNLRRVFDAAEAGGAVLLFDEADALFGKRSEVKDSHDRYANLEVSYLLQRMEAYRGLAILTTNLKGALDEAFQRRLRFTVAFPFPDAAQRAAIWRRVFPPETPTDGLDTDRLAQLNAPGGTIRTVALHAAFLAAEADAPVRMAHVRAAAQSVYAQQEKPLTDRELRGWT